MAEKIRKLLKTYKGKNGAVRDLGEKVKSGQITPAQAKKESKERGIVVDKLSFTPMGALFNIIGTVGFFLCIVPTIYKYSNMEILSYFGQFQVIEIPLIVIGIAVVIIILMTALMYHITRFRAKTGGCKADDFTVILITDGPYRIVRHPTHLCALGWIVALIIAISSWISFTILSIPGILMIVLAFYLMEVQEDKFNQVKFGDEYRRYMREVPRWNFIKGWLNLRK